MKVLVLVLVISCGRSPSALPDGSSFGSADAPMGDASGIDAAWVDIPDPPDTIATPCPSLLGFPSVPIQPYENNSNIATRVADINADGRLDLVQATQSTIVIRFGTGDGTFGDATEYPVEASPVDIVVVDVDGDAKPDVVSVNGTSISVLRNQGALGFAAEQTYATGGTRIAAGDLTGDHKPDLVVANSDGHTIGVFLNNGDGTFAPAVTYAAGMYPDSVAIGDVTGDGALDVVTADQLTATVSVFVNTGTGTFAAPTTLTSDAEPRDVELANVAGDAKLDIVVSDRTSANALELSVFVSQGNASFAARQDYAIGGAVFPRRFALADFNGDGRLDAAIPGGVDDSVDTVEVSLGTATGGFATATPYRSWGAYAAVAGDINGDGKLDIITAGQYFGTQIMLNQGDGTFPRSQAIPTSYEPWQVATRDLDGDGAIDLIVWGLDGTAKIYFNDGHGGFGAPIDEPGVSHPTRILVGDIDGNGKPDVLVINHLSVAAVWLNQGDRSFISSTVALPLDASISTLVDVDHDGDRDLVAANSTQLVVLSFANGAFSAGTTVAVTDATGIAAGDINHDGSQDIVIAQNGMVTTFIGNGGGGWSSHIDSQGVAGPLALGDMNGDGKLDLVSANHTLLGQGDGSFGTDLPYGGAGDPIVLRDLDGDGHLDVIGTLGDTVLIGRGNGDGTFRQSFYMTGGARTIAVADLDMDGRPDLISAQSMSTSSSATPNELQVLPGRCLP